MDFRINQLGIKLAIAGCNDKVAALKKLMHIAKVELKQIAFVGDDIIDIGVMKKVALSIAPGDAHQLVIDTAQYITSAKGGQGVARESAEYILKNSGLALEDMYSDMEGYFQIDQ